MLNSYTTTINNRVVTFTHLGNADTPHFENVTSVSVIPFTSEGKLVVVDLYHRGLDLPGGHVNPDEITPEETMKREVMEEASMTIRNPVLVDVIESDYFDGRPSYMLLYGVFVDELLDFVINDESRTRVILTKDEFIDSYEAGDKKLMRKAIDNAWKLLNENLAPAN